MTATGHADDDEDDVDDTRNQRMNVSGLATGSSFTRAAFPLRLAWPSDALRGAATTLLK